MKKEILKSLKNEENSTEKIQKRGKKQIIKKQKDKKIIKKTKKVDQKIAEILKGQKLKKKKLRKTF